MTAPRWEDVPESHAGDLCGSLADRRDAALLEARHCEDGSWWRARAEAAEAALARLAEPAQSSAAERWRAVPERAREAKLSELSDDITIYSASPDCDTDGIPYADHAEASRALLALAREAEGGGR